MAEKVLTHIIGTFLIQAEGAFLNGAGLGKGEDKNTTIPKTLLDFKDEVPYVSSQSWKRWLRDTYQDENPDDPATVIQTTGVNEKNNTNKLGSTLDPVEYAEDDIFGYMKTREGQGTTSAASDNEDEDDEEAAAGREKVKPTMRTSPFHASILMSLRKTGWRGLDKGFVHPKRVAPELLADKPEARSTPLPYDTKFYNTQLQGIFGLNYSRIGVFRIAGDRMELDPELERKYLKEERIILVSNRNGEKIYRLVSNPRKVRATKILKALTVLRGGAKQAQFGTPVHPQALIIAGLTCGNLIFNHLFEDAKEGTRFKLATFAEILGDFAERIVTPVYVGIRTGYFRAESEKELREWVQQRGENTSPKVVVCTPIQAVDQLTATLPA